MESSDRSYSFISSSAAMSSIHDPIKPKVTYTKDTLQKLMTKKFNRQSLLQDQGKRLSKISTVKGGSTIEESEMLVNDREEEQPAVLEFSRNIETVHQLMSDCTESLETMLPKKQVKRHFKQFKQLNKSQVYLASIIQEYTDMVNHPQHSTPRSGQDSDRLGRAMQANGLDELLQQTRIKNKCDEENFLANDVIGKVQKDSFMMSNFVKLLAKVSRHTPGNRPKIWKPNRFHIPKGIAEFEK